MKLNDCPTRLMQPTQKAARLISGLSIEEDLEPMTTGNIRDENLREYLEVFHATLQSTADQYLKSEFHKRLLHLSYLPAMIKGYVSTQFGTAMRIRDVHQYIS